MTKGRETTKQIHKLFWNATLTDKPSFVIWLFTRPPATLIYEILIPLFMAYALQAIITKHFDQVGQYAYWILGLGITYCILWAVGGIAISKTGSSGVEQIQKIVFSNYLSKDYDFYNSTFLGSLGAQAIALKDALIRYNQLILNLGLKLAITIISSILIIAYQSIPLVLLTLITMLVILSFTLLSGKWRLKYRRKLSEINSEVAGLVGDILGHAVTIKSFAKESYEMSRVAKPIKSQSILQDKAWLTSIPDDIGRILLATVTTILLLITTSRLYQNDSISIAVVILIQFYVIKLINSTQAVAEVIKEYESIMASAHQSIVTFLVQPTILDKLKTKQLPKGTKFNIELKNLKFRYPDAPKDVFAIQDFNLCINHGEKIGLVGYSGSGKTTLTKLLLRFQDLNSGKIEISGIDIRDLAQTELRSNISYVPQEPLLFHRSIFDNIAYGDSDAGIKKVMAAGQLAFVDEFVSELSNGYSTLVGERGVKLSGGQRQRVAIARAILKNAPILVLDEATSALDSKSEQYIQKALWNLMGDKTAIVIAHRLSTIQQMNRIIVMDKGEIVEVGTHQQLINQKGIYASLWQHQSGGHLSNS